MMIFTSFGFRSPIVAQKMKEHIPYPYDKTVLIIPFAGFHSEHTGIREREGLTAFGFKMSNIFILNEENAADMRHRTFDYLYVPGGNPFKLLSELQALDFLDNIRTMITAGSTYIGVSAGAMLTSDDIGYLVELEDNDYPLVNYCGLGLVDECIICHIDQLDPSAVIACKTASRNKPVLGIRNDEVIVRE